ncbi:MAG: MFS transporter [Ichthyobacteriaceae bacterium]|nr:MFS transporter [Ichthyobacteriaceae bacterium]
MSTKKNYALPIVMMFALFFMVAFVTNIQTPFAIVVKGQFGLSNFQSLLGNMATFIAYLVMGLPAGILLGKIGYKKTALIAVAVGFIGVSITLGSGYLSSFAVYITGAFISGFSMTLLNTVVNPMLNTLGGGGKKGNQLLTFGGALNSTGGTIAPIFAGILVGQIANPQISDVSPALFVAMAIFAVTFLVLYFVDIPEPNETNEETDIKADIFSALSFTHFKFGLVAIFLYVGIEVGIQSTAFLYMAGKVEEGGLGMDTGVVGSVIGTYWILMLLGRILGGFIAGKFTSRIMLSTVSLLGLVLILLAIIVPVENTVMFPAIDSTLSIQFQEIPTKMMFIVLSGLATSVMWPNIFNLATEGMGRYTAIASGLFMTMVVGGGILPAVLGALADGVGYIGSYWLVIASLAYLVFFALVGSKVKKA